MQITLVVFNLFLPAYPLDGGRIFADCLLLLGVPATQAATIVIIVAAVVAISLAVWGFVSGITTLILIGAWMAYSTFALYRFLAAGVIEQHPMFSFDPEADEQRGDFERQQSSTQI